MLLQHTAFANLQVDDAIQFRLTSGPACLNTDLHSAGLVGKREGYLGPVKVLGQGLVGNEGPGKGIVVIIALALQVIEKHLRHESSCENNAIQFRLTSGSACLNTDLHSAGLVGKREGT